MSERLFRVDPAPAMPLFDVHVNAMPSGVSTESGFDAPLPVEQVGKLGLAGGCLSTPMRLGRRANEALGQWCSGDRRWRPMAYLGGAGGPGAITRPRRLWASLQPSRSGLDADVDALDRFTGVKLMPHIDGVPGRDVLAEIARLRLPVLTYSGVGCPPGWIEEHLLAKLSGPVILAHLGSWPCAAELLKEAVALAVRCERVYLDTSGASIGEFIAYAAGQAPHKLLFASNAPMCDPAVQWAHVAAAVRDDAALERIAFANARALFEGKPGQTAADGGGRADPRGDTGGRRGSASHE